MRFREARRENCADPPNNALHLTAACGRALRALPCRPQVNADTLGRPPAQGSRENIAMRTYHPSPSTSGCALSTAGLLLAGVLFAGCGSKPAASTRHPAARAPAPSPSATENAAAIAAADAIAILDACDAIETRLATIGVEPQQFDPSRPTKLIVNGKLAMIGPARDRVRPKSALWLAHEQVGLLQGIGDKTLTFVVGGTRLEVVADAEKSIQEKAYVDFLVSSEERRAALYARYWTSLELNGFECRLGRALPMVNRIRSNALTVLALGAENGLLARDRHPLTVGSGRQLWQQLERPSWITPEHAKAFSALRKNTSDAVDAATEELDTLEADIKEIGSLRAEFSARYEPLSDVILARQRAGVPFSADLITVASSLAQALEFSRRLRADPEAPPETLTTLKNISSKLPAMKKLFCEEREPYIAEHGLVNFQNASQFRCKNEPPELVYKGSTIDMKAACAEAYATACP